jgi:hypothetical protein
MEPEVTLIITDERGRTTEVEVTSNRFTIGRSADNDLVLDYAGLSRYHAVIERFEGLVQVTDCGSRNGTLVNGRVVTGPAVLVNGDTIEVGEECSIRVRIRAGDQRPAGNVQHEGRSLANGWGIDLGAPVLAIAAVAVLLVIIVVAAVLIRNNDVTPVRNKNSITQDDGYALANSNQSQPANSDTGDGQGLSTEQIERATVLVLRQVSSDDKPYVFPPGSTAALDDIKRRIEQYKQTSSLASTLSTLSSRGTEVAALARREGIEPHLVLFTALAETDGGASGRDPVATARQIMPTLLWLRKMFGTESADKSLIIVAAYKMGPATKKTHPLLGTLRRLVKDPLTQRNVWYLNEQGGLEPQVYGFVIRFLALGVIAQNPRQHGIAADPVAF